MGLFGFSFNSRGAPGTGNGQPGVPSGQTSPYPATGTTAAPGPDPHFTSPEPAVTPGNGDPVGPGSLAAGLSAINDYVTALDFPNLNVAKEKDAFANSKFVKSQTPHMYDGGTSLGVQYNDKDNTEFVDLPTPSPMGFSDMTTFKMIGPPGKRRWTTDDVHYYDLSTNPPRLGKPPPPVVWGF